MYEGKSEDFTSLQTKFTFVHLLRMQHHKLCIFIKRLHGQAVLFCMIYVFGSLSFW